VAAISEIASRCECERDQITLTLSGGSSDGALRGVIRGNQEAIHETHLRGVTIEFNQEAIKRQSSGNQEAIKSQSSGNQESIKRPLTRLTGTG
jgi:hypothetical protein